MFQSVRYSQVAIRIGLALVFFWLGISMFILPQTMASKNIVSLLGMFDILVAVSIATGFFMRWFAGAAILLLLAMLALNGLTEVTIRDLGLVGALVALILWPERTYI